MGTVWARRAGAAIVVTMLAACGSDRAQPPAQGGPGVAPPTRSADSGPPHRVDSRPPPLAEPVKLWEAGRAVRDVDAAKADVEGHLLVDLGDAWTPYLFTVQGTAAEPIVPNTYRATYLALARGEFPDDLHGARARDDKYLELYGIAPTLGLLRARFRELRARECVASLRYDAVRAFDQFLSYQTRHRGKPIAESYRAAKREMDRLLARRGAADLASLDRTGLDAREQRIVQEYDAVVPKFEVIREVQERLRCEGFFPPRARVPEGAFDWITHEALVDFERRHRIFGWGFIGNDTLEALRRDPLENERLAVVRVLTERAMHAAGVIEDGSTRATPDGQPRMFRGADGEEHPIPNLEEELSTRIVEAFGLSTAESTFAWLEGLGELPPEASRVVAIPAPRYPEYYDGNMELFVQVDRGDVWYDFPYDDAGREVSQPVSRRPRVTIFTEYLGQKIPLARFGTTIGGWRTEFVEGITWWKYKESPPGPRYWHEIIASPVWLPPNTTPPGDLLRRTPRNMRGVATKYIVNYHETGPSYASAYGLVAAYHMKGRQLPDGSWSFYGDEGIRMHGSVDYMSIMRRHSHGCHRLHNHIAVRLMSFVLAHRPHVRQGQQRLAFRLPLEHDGEEHVLAIDHGGYVFKLVEPVPVEVLEGTIRGELQKPIEHLVPRFDADAGCYLLPDGGAVRVNRAGEMLPIPRPVQPAPDGGVLAPAAGFDAGLLAAPPPLPTPAVP